VGFYSLSTSIAAVILTNKNCIAELVLLWENVAELLFGWIYNTDDFISPSVNIYSLRVTCSSVPAVQQTHFGLVIKMLFDTVLGNNSCLF
jgi:hypothetical protein